MEDLLKIGLVWFLVSIPVSLLVGRFLAGAGRSMTDSVPYRPRKPLVRVPLAHRVQSLVASRRGELVIKK